jgi:hypothetical protein
MIQRKPACIAATANVGSGKFVIGGLNDDLTPAQVDEERFPGVSAD